MAGFRSRRLTREEIARFVNEPSDSELEDEAEDAGSDPEDNVELLSTGDDPLPEVAPLSESEEDEPRPPTLRSETASLANAQTRSQRKLTEAVFEPLVQDAAVFQTRRRDVVTAEWSTEPGPTNRRRDASNILTERPGLRSRAAREAHTEHAAADLFLSTDIVEMITARTNKKLDQLRARFIATASEDDVGKSGHLLERTDVTEMRAFLGLNLLRGTVPLESADELFYGGFGPPQFRATMGKKRYIKLMTAVTLDELDTREERRRGDRFCLAREVFDMFDANLRLHFTPSECITVDETLVKFRGRCSFRVYMPSKPGRYGILIRSVSDAYNRYVLKIWPYAGRPVEPELAPPGVVLDTVPALVRHLVRDYANTGRNVTMDRYFTSIELIEQLRDEMGLTVVGTLRANRVLLPKEMTNPAGRRPDTSKICHRNDVQLVSYCPKEKKVVLVASSQHRMPMVDSITKKPEVVLYYNSTKGGIDVCDAITESTTCQAAIRRWQVRVLLYMLAVTGLNAYHIFCLANPDSSHCDAKHGGRMRFLRALAHQLIEPQLERRADQFSSMGVINQKTAAAIQLVLNRPGASRAAPSASSGTTASRCHFCVTESHGPGHKRRKNSLGRVTRCAMCSRPACREHSLQQKVCTQCHDADEEASE